MFEEQLTQIPGVVVGRVTGVDDRGLPIVSTAAGEIPATQAQYRRITDDNPSTFTGDDMPVTNVGPFEIAAYLNALSREAGLDPCYKDNSFACDMTKSGFRLPSLLESEAVEGSGLLSGGAFGPEGSVPSLGILSVVALVLAGFALKKRLPVPIVARHAPRAQEGAIILESGPSPAKTN